MKNKFMFSVTIIIMIVIFGGCSEKTEVEQVVVDKNAWFFDLSDDLINTAIAKGSENDKSAMFSLEHNYLIRSTENNLLEFKDHPPHVYFRSPYYQLTTRAYNNSQKMIIPKMEDMKKLVRENNLDFSINAYGNTLTMGGNFHAVLKQGNITIQPINGKVVMSDSPPIRVNVMSENAPQYKKIIKASFLIDDRIDLRTPISLVFIYSGKEDNAVYEFKVKH